MNYLNETSTYTKNTNRYKNQKRNSTSKKLTFSRISTFSSILLVCFYWSGIRDYVPSCAIVAIRSVSEHIQTIENKSLLFPLQCCSVQVFFFIFVILWSFWVSTRDKKMKNRSQFTTNSSKIKFLITRKHIHTQQKKGRLTHTGKQKATSTKRKYFARAKQNGFIFFVLSFTIWESRNKRKFKENSMYMEKML